MDTQQLIRRRKALGINKATLARQVGVAGSTVTRWERGGPISPLARIALETALLRLERQRDGGAAVGV